MHNKPVLLDLQAYIQIYQTDKHLRCDLHSFNSFRSPVNLFHCVSESEKRMVVVPPQRLS